MSKNIVIHPQYHFLRSYITQLPHLFLSEGTYIHDGRNKIKYFTTNGLQINVKRYRIPIVFNRFIYTYFRKSKAQRAYEFALKLNEQGINTPFPIAYILEKRYGILGYSYFISTQVNYPRRFYEFGTNPLTEENKNILQAFAKYTAKLHQKGIYHQDYSPGNILFDIKNGTPEFCIVDINRMQFGPVSLQKGCANFARLWGTPEMFRIMATTYAEAQGWDIETVCSEVLKSRKKFWQKVTRKHPAKFPLEF